MASTYEPIATTTLGSSQSGITFSSIPQTYTDLILVCNATDVRALAGTDVTGTVNGQTTNLSWTFMQGTGSSALSARGTNSTVMFAGIGSGTTLSTTIVQFLNYSNTTTYKTCLYRNGSADSAVRAGVGLWRSTSAITSVTINGEQGFVAGSVATLYGIKAA